MQPHLRERRSARDYFVLVVEDAAAPNISSPMARALLIPALGDRSHPTSAMTRNGGSTLKERSESADSGTMKTGISQQLGESSRGTNDSTTVAATGPSNDEDAFARWQAIEAGADPDAPASSQRARQQTPVVDETPGTTATQEDRFVLPGWVTAPRASAFAGVVVLVALAAIGLAWHNWQTSQRWENVADRAIARSSEHASEISLLKAELATSNGDAARLQTQVETLASDSAASADEAALFEQATRAGQTAVDDIVTCVGAQFDLNAVAYQYTDPPTAAMDDRLAQMAEDVSYWCGQAADSAAAFDQAVQFTVR